MTQHERYAEFIRALRACRQAGDDYPRGTILRVLQEAAQNRPQPVATSPAKTDP